MNRPAATMPADELASTNWPGLFLSMMLPVVTAAAFIYESLVVDWREMSDVWLSGLFLLIPLEVIRIIILSSLGDAYKSSDGPMQAARSFLLSVAVLLVLGSVVMFLQLGARDAIYLFTHRFIYEVIGVPVLIMVIDSIVGILAFRGDMHDQAKRLDAVVSDSFAWVGFAGIRAPFVLLPLYGLLAWANSAGLRFAEWVPAPSRNFAVQSALFYTGCYFLGKGVFMAHVQTRHFAVTGRRLFDNRWMPQWFGKGDGS